MKYTTIEILKYVVLYPIIIVLAWIGFLICTKSIVDQVVAIKIEKQTQIEQQAKLINLMETECVCLFKSQN